MEPPRNLQVSKGHTFMQIIAGLEMTMDPDFVGDNRYGIYVYITSKNM